MRFCAPCPMANVGPREDNAGLAVSKAGAVFSDAFSLSLGSVRNVGWSLLALRRSVRGFVLLSPFSEE